VKLRVLFFSLILLLFVFQNAEKQLQAQPLFSLERLCILYPDEINQLFQSLDLELPALQRVKNIYENQDLPSACLELVSYYKNGRQAEWLRKQKPFTSNEIMTEAETILQDTFEFQGVKGRQPRLQQQGLDWHYLGPNEDREWGYFLNRHGVFLTLLEAWQQTGNQSYVRYFDAAITDWIINNSVPEEEANDVVWRELEAGLRLAGSWPKLFYGFLQAEGFSPVSIILMLYSVQEHAEYVKNYHRIHHNWAAMEMNGLAQAAVCWPEFKNSNDWYNHAAEAMLEEIRYEVYPDGVQKELTSHYHLVALRNFEEFVSISRQAYKKISPEYREVLEKMNHYLAYSLQPSGHGPLNNDSDLNDHRAQLMEKADVHSRLDWKFIASNGKTGIEPEQTSVFFPWAGQMIFRNGWSQEAFWGFFDAGPWGISHQHNDQLHLSVYAYGRNLLVDAGRYWYRRDPWRTYFLNSVSHNVILVDGLGQLATNELATEPVENDFKIGDDFDYIHSAYKSGFGPEGISARHERTVIFLKKYGWLVVDRITAAGNHKVEPLWHFAPDCGVVSKGNLVKTDDKGLGNLLLIPDQENWEVKLVRGETDPIQGWYSREYNQKEPSTCAIFSKNIQDQETFGWLLLPFREKEPAWKLQRVANQLDFVQYSLELEDDRFDIIVNFKTDQPILVNGKNVDERVVVNSR
jgi:hypothetical protein